MKSPSLPQRGDPLKRGRPFAANAPTSHLLTAVQMCRQKKGRYAYPREGSGQIPKEDGAPDIAYPFRAHPTMQYGSVPCVGLAWRSEGGGPILTADIPLVDEARKGRRLRYRRHHLQRPIDATQSTVCRQPLVCAPRRRYLAQVRSQSGAVWGGWGVRLGGGWGGAILLGA